MKKTYWFITATLVLLFFLCGVGSASAQGRPFITKWNCKKGKEVPIPIIGTYKMLITDASGQEKVNETVTVVDANHPYIFKPTEDGIYTVTAGPEGVERIQTENRNYIELIEVVQFGTVEWTSMEDAFQRCLNMTFAENIDIPNLSKVTSMSNMFFECNAFNSSLKGWDVSHVTNMWGMFYNCTSFNQSLTGWDVSKVTDMRQMFYNCTSFNQSLGSWKIKTAVGSLGKTAMSVENYSKSLVGWAEWAKQADIRDIKFNNNVQGLVYNAKGKAARAELIKRGWIFEGDIEQTFEVTLVPPEHGTLAIEGYTTETLKKVSDETELTITATTTEEGYELKELQVNGTKLEGKTFKVMAKTTVTAVFGLKTFPVTASVKDGKGGTVKLEGAANLDAVEYGTTLTVVATPDEANGYNKLKAVTVNGTPLAEGVMLFVVKEAKTVEVEFALKTFPVTKELKGVSKGEITITGAANLDAVEYGTELTVEATTTEAGYELKELQVNGTKLEGKTFKVTGEAKVTAVFEKKQENAVEDALLAHITVAPNPFSSQLRIVNPEGIAVRYELVTLTGSVVRAGALEGTETMVDTETLPAGLYFVRLKAQGGARKTLKMSKSA